MFEFLLELLSEDIPARMQAEAADELKRLVTERLAASGVAFGSAVAHSTPRRLALAIDGLPERSPDRTEERKGPKLGAPDAAIQGFLKSAGLASLAEAELRDTDKGQVYFATRRIPGEATETILGAAIVAAIDTLAWPKSMRWASARRRWVRPLSGVLAIFDGRIVHLPPADELPLAGAATIGHRFLGPQAFSVTGFADYEQALEEHHVVLDREKRKWRILGDARRRAEEERLQLVHDEALLDEVVGLVEWPVVLTGSIDDRFMDLPPELRRTTMRANQKYFTLETAEGKPAARFLIVSNMETADRGAAIVAGNERVLRARLSDARFFYDQDRKTPLADLRSKLAKIAFHAKLGTMLERVERIAALSKTIGPLIAADDDTALLAVAAARLAKCDLVSGMVGEFPELQGVMGRYYALDQGEPEAVADAIRDHYKPLGPNDACPTAPVSVTVALADKIDTLVGFFAIGETPTGSKDPFALRRAALGVIRLIVENGLRLPLTQLFFTATGRYGEQGLVSLDDGAQSRTGQESLRDEIHRLADRSHASALMAFFADRLKVVLKERGVRHDLIDAVFALGGEDDLVRLLARVEALQEFLASEDGANLLTAYRRAANILKIEEKRDGAAYDGEADSALFEAVEERALAESLDSAGAAVDSLIGSEDFRGAMALYARLRPVVDAFFDRVTVNAPDAAVRQNRLRLLSRIRGTLNKIADFSRIA